MKRTHFISLIIPALAVAGTKAAHERRNARGWTVIVSRKLLNEEPETASTALKLLETKLVDVEKSVPAEAVKKLQTVRIWVEHPESGVSKCAAYHPSEKWLTNHGHNPAMARCVEFGNPKLFIEWSGIQPSMVLHELAHAYHHQVLSHKYQALTATYKHALENNLYARVKHANGPTKKAYALNNEKEYFAELTEAYFGRNDFFPFINKELKEYDPIGFAMVESAWKVQATESSPTPATA